MTSFLMHPEKGYTLLRSRGYSIIWEFIFPNQFNNLIKNKDLPQFKAVVNYFVDKPTSLYIFGRIIDALMERGYKNYSTISLLVSGSEPNIKAISDELILASKDDTSPFDTKNLHFKIKKENSIRSRHPYFQVYNNFEVFKKEPSRSGTAPISLTFMVDSEFRKLIGKSC